jgi:hypothetical protein
MYIDSIADDDNRDRTGMVYIGDDSGGTSGPNSGSAERFAFLAFYDPDVASGDDDLQLRARELNAPAQSWNTTGDWTLVSGGITLSYDTWYSIRVDIDVTAGTYDVYVDDVLGGAGISHYEDYPSSSVTHISFSTGTAAQGDFFVDNVGECADGCIDNAECDDGEFCNGAEECISGICQPGADPCPGQLCDEVSETCVDCLSDSDCEDTVFCNGDETCVSGACQPGTDPCPGQFCDESGMTCFECSVDLDCDDGAF